MDAIQTHPTKAVVTLTQMPAGYPNADAREWADFSREFRAVARAHADKLGRAVEVYDADDSLIEVVQPSEQ